MSSGWLSIVEYARQYNVSDMTVRRRIKTGRLSAELRDGKYYIPAREERSSSLDQNILPSRPVAIASRDKEEAPGPQTPVIKIRLQEIPKETVANSPTEADLPPRVERPNGALSGLASTSVDPNRLLEFCESLVEKLLQREELLKMTFQNEKKYFESEIKNLHQEVSRLKQDNEDLECLVKLLEKRLQ